MKSALRLVLIAALFAACVSSELLAAGFGGPTADGWHTWRVEAAAGELQIHALMRSGKPVKLRVLSLQCAVTADSEITDLGLVEADGSIDWLQRYIEPRSELSSDAIMALSLHSGDRPVTVLANLASHGADWESREQALFWLAHSGSDAAFEFLEKLF